MKEYKLVDLSLPIMNGGPFRRPAEITYMSHITCASELGKGYHLSPGDFPNGKYCGFEKFTFLTAHTGAHMDAPWHYGDTYKGQRTKTIDEIPLEWCFNDGVVLNFSWKKTGEGISAQEIQQELEQIKYTLKPYDIVLIRTDTSRKYFGKPNWENMHPGATRDATIWLANQGIKVVGIDSWSWDRPHEFMVADYKQGIKNKFWEAHYAALEKEIIIMEWLDNFHLLPAFGFKLSVFPIKIQGGSGGWIRAVAFVKKGE